MKETHRPPFPAWLDKARRRDARRWAKMSGEEMLTDIHQRAQEALEWAANRSPASHNGRSPRRASPS